MRTVESTLVVMISLALSFGLATTAAAQAEPAPVTFVTGTVTEAHGYVASEGEEPDVYDIRGFEYMSHQPGGVIREVVEWSDPRLPTDLWLTIAYTLVRPDDDGDDGAINFAWRSLMEDEAGRWVGTGRNVVGGDETYSLHELTGEGAYEGLTALLHDVTPADAHGPWPLAFEGYIFEAELTPFPDVPVPVTTGGEQLYPFPMEPPEG